MNWETILYPIRSLESNEVFVFGSNSTGFHGAGAAGMAMRGDASNSWRQDSDFLLAKSAPPGHSNRIGKWAVYGEARGFQEGKEGKSYAIETILHPGELRSVSRRDIYSQLIELVEYAKSHPELKFIITEIGSNYAGYTSEEMQVVWDELEKRHGIPTNTRFVKMPQRRKQ